MLRDLLRARIIHREAFRDRKKCELCRLMGLRLKVHLVHCLNQATGVLAEHLAEHFVDPRPLLIYKRARSLYEPVSL